MTTTTTVLLCGVGGQGTILAADLLAHAALGADKNVKVSEIHGMAQRGGSVTTVVRFGERVNSMVCDIGIADVIVSFEIIEALRNINQLKENGTIIVNDEFIKPLPVLTGNTQMPSGAREDLESYGALLIPASKIAEGAGSIKASNVVLLGALSSYLDFPISAWEDTVRDRVPQKTIDINLKAFQSGRNFVEK